MTLTTRRLLKCGPAVLAVSSLASAQATNPPAPQMDTILYGAAYYNEYTPAPVAAGRLEKDVALMKAAGISVVRLGESSWAKWEPEEGKFEFAWMDRIVQRLNEAGIKVIMGTPTYSIPVWMYAKHPDILARPLGGGETGYGMRQNMNIDDPNYRRYSQEIITALVRHYRDNPNVIGWQVDNETSAYGSANASVHLEFIEWLKARYETPDDLNAAWLLSYWGQTVSRWEDIPTRDKANSTGYKLDWDRFQQWRASRFVAWQADLIRKNARSDQFITHNHAGMTRIEVDAVQMDAPLNVVGNDIYFSWQDEFDGWEQTFQGDLARSVKNRNFFVLETNARTQGWDATRQLPPYDGQMYQDVFTHIANGANLVSYWHWSTLHGGQETYWGGVLGHDLEPNRAYAEVSRIGNDLRRIGPRLVDLKRQNDVAILYSIDANSALDHMPYSKVETRSLFNRLNGYTTVLRQLHRSLYKLNIGTDIVYSDQASSSELEKYKVIIVPALHVADDALLRRISDYVKRGGHVVMTYRSGFANENALVRWERAPGPLREAAGLSYQEVSTLLRPIGLQGDPFSAGTDNQVSTIAELLQVTTARPLAWYDHPFFGKWPAITLNQFGKGTVLYQGTQLSDGLQEKVVIEELKRADLWGVDQELPAGVRVKHALSESGKRIHFFFNYSSASISVNYKYRSASDMVSGVRLVDGQDFVLGPWGVVVAEEE